MPRASSAIRDSADARLGAASFATTAGAAFVTVSVAVAVRLSEPLVAVTVSGYDAGAVAAVVVTVRRDVPGTLTVAGAKVPVAPLKESETLPANPASGVTDTV